MKERSPREIAKERTDAIARTGPRDNVVGNCKRTVVYPQHEVWIS